MAVKRPGVCTDRRLETVAALLLSLERMVLLGRTPLALMARPERVEALAQVVSQQEETTVPLGAVLPV